MSSNSVTIEIQASDGDRLDAALLRELRVREASVSRSQLKAWFEGERILLRGRVVRASQPLEPGVHSVTLPEEALRKAEKSLLVSKQGSSLPVVYEDDSILVLNKRSGTPSAPLRASESETAVGSALAHFPLLPQIPDQPLEPGLLHRLDTGTSGLLAFAKTFEEWKRLKQEWKSGGVRKTYRAIVVPQDTSARVPSRIETPLAHDLGSSKRMVAVIPGSRTRYRGKLLPAQTLVLGSMEAGRGRYRDLEIEITTGVMHQIRCHLASVGLPILGDSIYGPANEAPRLWLHAWQLELPLASGRRLELQAELPQDWPAQN